MNVVSILKWFRFRRPKPPTPRAGNKMIWLEGSWIEVCAICGGNCGQCGTSVGMDVQPSMHSEKS